MHHLITQISQICKEICDIKKKGSKIVFPTSMPALLVQRALMAG